MLQKTPVFRPFETLKKANDLRKRWLSYIDIDTVQNRVDAAFALARAADLPGTAGDAAYGTYRRLSRRVLP